ncbi:MAG: radical SAM protein, partial [Sedimentisphaerales bacterium]|nr:radical SAM protein [Sedimentisphaerales bacterium]
VDIVPLKVCTLDCIYCQLGRTAQKTLQRRQYVPPLAVLAEIEHRLAEGLDADFITISGSGEPTLNSALGEIIVGIKNLTKIPVAIMTNGTLLYDKDVRADCAKADVVLPSLDAADEQTFRKINRPYPDISIEKLISGLSSFRDEFAGRIWLEVFLVEDVNTDAAAIAKISEAIKRIRPDKIHLNTAVRPTAEKNVRRVDVEKLNAIAAQLGPRCEVVADFSPQRYTEHVVNKAQDVLSVLKRRPCSLDDICSGLGISQAEALKYITHFRQQGLVHSEQKGDITFFRADLAPP